MGRRAFQLHYEAKIRELEKAIDKLHCALKLQHKWQCEAGEMGICKDGAGEWIVLDMGAEYGDSTMCELTLEALDFVDRVRSQKETPE